MVSLSRSFLEDRAKGTFLFTRKTMSATHAPDANFSLVDTNADTIYAFFIENYTSVMLEYFFAAAKAQKY